MKKRGKWYWREGWYSICSRHKHHDDNCALCRAGEWRPILLIKISNLFYKISPKAWRKVNEIYYSLMEMYDEYKEESELSRHD